MRNAFKLLTMGLLVTIVFAACSSSNDSNDDKAQEFIATLDDFQGYTSWTKVHTATGEDPLLGDAHGAKAPLTRNVFFKDNVQPDNGKYPNGTLIVKELRDGNGDLAGALTMMVKRGGDFNPDGDGWEWFMTTTDLDTVLTQGDNATAGGGMCASCHAAANTNNNGTDWVFSR
ncbi:MAG: hypothetical protein GF313_10795 [Caldithrix sp.]|nr:hypothetical protein [Caldithrix sp.]